MTTSLPRDVHSRLAACSFMRSMQVFIATTACAIDVSGDFEPSVLVSRSSSCSRNSRPLADLAATRQHGADLGEVRLLALQFLGDVDAVGEHRDLAHQVGGRRGRRPRAAATNSCTFSSRRPR
jgi:hypothetical protein